MIELHAFRLVAGADEEAFVACDKRVQTDFAYQQPGLLRRTTARGSDGGWVVIHLWTSEQAADEARARAASDPTVEEWTGFVDPVTLRSGRWFELD